MTDKSATPRTPAAFINVIAEIGTKGEAVEYLQKTWDEKCQLERELAAACEGQEHLIAEKEGLQRRLAEAEKSLDNLTAELNAAIAQGEGER